MKYGELTLGQMEAIVNKLGGMEGVKHFLADETVIRERPNFKIWQTVKLGLHESVEEYRNALDGDCQINFYARSIFKQIPISQEVVEVDLVLVDGYELGFQYSVPQSAIYKVAFRRGLDECPAEVGLALAEQCNQLDRLLVYIGMKPIIVSEYGPRVLYLERSDSELWICADRVDSDELLSPARKWVFVLPRK